MLNINPRQSAILPEKPRPIVSIGLGGIVHDAHYPAYKIAGFEVISGYDIDAERAAKMKDKFDIPIIYDSLEATIAAAPKNAVFDIAVPGNAVSDILVQLPEGSATLIQKPMGDNLSDAREILAASHARKLTAAVNFQLRFAPFIIAARDMIENGIIGEVYDMEARMQINTPWHLWQFLYALPRVEILYHSIHYIDLARSFFGTPSSVYAKTLNHPIAPGLKGGTRSTVIMDYGENPRVNIMTNHSHAYGAEKQQSYFKFEGEKGAIRIRAGLNMNYPDGVPDKFEYVLLDDADDKDPTWQELEISGSWFPEAFIGTMASLMRAANGETDQLPTTVEDAFETMAVVEAAYRSSAEGGTPIPEA